MKTFVAIGLSALFLVAVAAAWGTYSAAHPVAATASASQIYIHGTPVCVFQHGKSIVARVGECGPGASRRDEPPAGTAPDLRGAEPGLPPGHPPVGPDMPPDGAGRRLVI
ncbi:MAG: hypothetical protein ACM3NF_03395 [Gemmatimonadota bacterium]